MLLFCDSFDHYATTDLLEKYSSAANAAIVGGGRTGNALQLSYYQGNVTNLSEQRDSIYRRNSVEANATARLQHHSVPRRWSRSRETGD